MWKLRILMLALPILYLAFRKRIMNFISTMCITRAITLHHSPQCICYNFRSCNRYIADMKNASKVNYIQKYLYSCDELGFYKGSILVYCVTDSGVYYLLSKENKKYNYISRYRVLNEERLEKSTETALISLQKVVSEHSDFYKEVSSKMKDSQVYWLACNQQVIYVFCVNSKYLELPIDREYEWKRYDTLRDYATNMYCYISLEQIHNELFGSGKLIRGTREKD